MPEDEQPPEHLLEDDFELDMWWAARNNPVVNRMKTSSKNSKLGNKENFSFSF